MVSSRPPSQRGIALHTATSVLTYTEVPPTSRPPSQRGIALHVLRRLRRGTTCCLDPLHSGALLFTSAWFRPSPPKPFVSTPFTAGHLFTGLLHVVSLDPLHSGALLFTRRRRVIRRDYSRPPSQRGIALHARLGPELYVHLDPLHSGALLFTILSYLRPLDPLHSGALLFTHHARTASARACWSRPPSQRGIALHLIPFIGWAIAIFVSTPFTAGHCSSLCQHRCRPSSTPFTAGHCSSLGHGPACSGSRSCRLDPLHSGALLFT